MVRNGAVGDLGGTVADHDHVLQSSGTGEIGPLVRPSLRTPGA
jgi:hypothetical protein